MICKFNHEGDCCNSGAVQYMCKCKQPCYEIIPMTNGDLIRSMDDETLATQLVQVFKEGILALVDMEVPDKLLDEAWKCFLDKLKQPAEVGHGN